MTGARGIVTSVGYTLALASLGAMIVAPVSYALADEGADPSTVSTAITSSQSNASVALEKDETVNVSTYADGSVKNVKVSTTLKTGGNTDVADATSLGDLKADDEDVSFSQEGELVWHSPSGKDIVYTGTTNAALPIEIKVTYRYNGSYITPQELRGKSGHVVIRYDYINNSQTTSDGIQVYTPFAAMTGLMLDKDVFSNVKLKNGRLIEDGDRLIALGYAMPGLASSLDAGGDFEVPDYFEVEADAVNFELGSSLTMVSPDLLDGFDASDFNTGEYADASSGLKSAMAELTKGSNELADGLKELANGAKSLSEGASQLDANLVSATNEVPALTNSIAQLHAGSTNLANGIGEFKQQLVNTKGSLYQMQQGAAQISSALESGQLQQLANVLTKAAQELEADSQVMAKIEELKTNVQNDVVGAQDSYNSMRSDVITAIRASNATDAQKRSLEDMINSYDVSTKLGVVSNDVADLASYASQLSVGDTQVAIGALQAADFTQLSAGAKELSSGLQQVVDGFGDDGQANTLIGAAASLQSGADQIDQGLAMLEGKSNELATGMSQIASGVSQISQGASQLSDATQQAADGSGSMAEGLQKFNDEGVSKIADVIDNKLVKLGNRFAAVTNAGGSYKNFAGITEGTAGSVKFVFETEAIENE